MKVFIIIITILLDILWAYFQFEKIPVELYGGLPVLTSLIGILFISTIGAKLLVDTDK